MSFRAITIPETRNLIRWSIGDAGFDMELSGACRANCAQMLREDAKEINADENMELWAIHPGGRSILDAVQAGLELQADKLAVSRSILRRFGNMSSATVMFVLQRADAHCPTRPARLRHVIRAGTYCGDDEIPCPLNPPSVIRRKIVQLKESSDFRRRGPTLRMDGRTVLVF